jgi:hypothetical protein
MSSISWCFQGFMDIPKPMYRDMNPFTLVNGQIVAIGVGHKLLQHLVSLLFTKGDQVNAHLRVRYKERNRYINIYHVLIST